MLVFELSAVLAFSLFLPKAYGDSLMIISASEYFSESDFVPGDDQEDDMGEIAYRRIDWGDENEIQQQDNNVLEHGRYSSTRTTSTTRRPSSSSSSSSSSSFSSSSSQVSYAATTAEPGERAWISLGDHTACRGELGYASPRYEYVNQEADSLDRCKVICDLFGEACFGIQYNHNPSLWADHCQLWIRPILGEAIEKDSECFLKSPQKYISQGPDSVCRGVGGSNHDSNYRFADRSQFKNVEDCQRLCTEMGSGCFGVEYAKDRCELHVQEIALTAYWAGHTCYVKGRGRDGGLG
eukprot:g45893.t1